MKQVLILSGKGGTGKTTIASAFIKLTKARACADCDVDAPNLHLVHQQKTVPERYDYYGMAKAVIDEQLCTGCNLCHIHCHFDAIRTGTVCTIDPFACEGCGVCIKLCPLQAISLQPAIAGEQSLYRSPMVFSTACLHMGSGTSGKLVAEVKKKMQSSVVAGTELAIIDGSPGIGCPVIASLSGVDLVLIVTEPSVSGISDMKRIIQTAEQFQIKISICINKYDTNGEKSKEIEKFCQDRGFCFAGGIPFDSEAVKTVNLGQTVIDRECPAGQAVKDVFSVIECELKKIVEVEHANKNIG